MKAQLDAQEDLVAAIVAAYRDASPEDIERGRDWYPRAGRMIAELAAWSGLDTPTMAAVVAALSPRNPWNWNVADAAAIAQHAAMGGPLPKVTTFDQNRDRAVSIAAGRSDWTTSAPKVRSFVRNMTGDVDAVTVDVWAIKVATAGKRSEVRSDADYWNVAQAYQTAAGIVGETPRELQAIVWVNAERVGLASKRRGRIGESIKRGTLPFVIGLLTA